jgi:hypothetical protein
MLSSASNTRKSRTSVKFDSKSGSRRTYHGQFVQRMLSGRMGQKIGSKPSAFQPSGPVDSTVCHVCFAPDFDLSYNYNHISLFHTGYILASLSDNQPACHFQFRVCARVTMGKKYLQRSSRRVSVWSLEHTVAYVYVG